MSISGQDVFLFLGAMGFHKCDEIGGDPDNVVMSRDCDDPSGYVGVPIRQPRLPITYLRYTLEKVGLTLDDLQQFLGQE